MPRDDKKDDASDIEDDVDNDERLRRPVAIPLCMLESEEDNFVVCNPDERADSVDVVGLVMLLSLDVKFDDPDVYVHNKHTKNGAK